MAQRSCKKVVRCDRKRLSEYKNVRLNEERIQALNQAECCYESGGEERELQRLGMTLKLAEKVVHMMIL